MRNLESLAELKKQGKMRIEERRDNFVRQSLLSDEFLDLIHWSMTAIRLKVLRQE